MFAATARLAFVLFGRAVCGTALSNFGLCCVKRSPSPGTSSAHPGISENHPQPSVCLCMCQPVCAQIEDRDWVGWGGGGWGMGWGMGWC